MPWHLKIIYLPKLSVFEPFASCHLLESGIGFGLVLFKYISMAELVTSSACFVSLIEYIDYKQHMEESWPMRQYKLSAEMVKSSANMMAKDNSRTVIDEDNT